MLVPLYAAAYDRLDVGTGTHVLGLGCGSGLALLVAAGRGASVTGVEDDESRLALARERLLPGPGGQDAPAGEAELVRASRYAPVRPGARGRTPNVVTAFHSLPDAASLSRTAEGLERGTPVVLAGWGPPERCAAASVLSVTTRGAGPVGGEVGHWAPGGRDGLEELALGSGLRLDGSGRVSCPFGYADTGSAARGLLSTDLYGTSVDEADRKRLLGELSEAVQPYVRADGTVWMANLFRYVIARAE
jgi:SAM-dependent methyltransferase